MAYAIVSHILKDGNVRISGADCPALVFGGQKLPKHQKGGLHLFITGFMPPEGGGREDYDDLCGDWIRDNGGPAGAEDAGGRGFERARRPHAVGV